MIARILKSSGPFRAGQMFSDGRVPPDTPNVEWFDEDDPILRTIGEHNIVQNDEVQPLKPRAETPATPSAEPEKAPEA